MSTIRPEVQEACNRLLANDEDFTKLVLGSNVGTYRNLNQTETDSLISALRENTHVKSMTFNNCHDSGPENSAFVNFVAETLIPNHLSLERLVLVGNKVPDEVAEKIAGALKKNTSMVKFFLGFNSLSVSGVRALAESVRHNCCLTSFGLGGNLFGLDSCQRIVSSISSKPNFDLFTSLWLLGNNLGVEDSKVVADFIPRAKSLHFITLDFNRLGDKGCQYIAEALPKSSSIETIRLSGNNISDLGCNSIAHALRENCSLCDLELKGNTITDAGAAALTATLRNTNATVLTLDLSGNAAVSYEQREQIQYVCNTNVRISIAFDHLKSNLPKISFGLWPKALEVVETKPDLLFDLIKAKPDLFRQRRTQRKRKCPARLQY